MLRTEPESWRIHHSVTRMYHAVAATDPAYGDQARRFLQRSRELAPNRALFPRLLEPPDSLALRQLEDGRHVLHWRWSQGAGYHAIAESHDGGAWWHVLHAYDRAVTSFVVPETRLPGTWRYPRQGVPLPRRLQRLGRMAAHHRATVTVAGRGTSPMPASAGCQPGRTVSAWARNSASSAAQVCRSPWRTST